MNEKTAPELGSNFEIFAKKYTKSIKSISIYHRALIDRVFGIFYKEDALHEVLDQALHRGDITYLEYRRFRFRPKKIRIIITPKSRNFLYKQIHQRRFTS